MIRWSAVVILRCRAIEAAMELNRNQYFLAGLIVMLIGIQLRLVDAFVLNEHATHFLHQRMQQIKAQQFASAGDASGLPRVRSYREFGPSIRFGQRRPAPGGFRRGPPANQ